MSLDVGADNVVDAFWYGDPFVLATTGIVLTSAEATAIGLDTNTSLRTTAFAYGWGLDGGVVQVNASRPYPEPATFACGGIGIVAGGIRRRRKQNARHAW